MQLKRQEKSGFRRGSYRYGGRIDMIDWRDAIDQPNIFQSAMN
jgi:hypothetical protein